MVVTKEFVVAMVECIQSTRANAESVEKDPQAKGDDAVGKILRHRVEVMRQASDTLTGWVKRNAAEAGCDPEHFDI